MASANAIIKWNRIQNNKREVNLQDSNESEVGKYLIKYVSSNLLLIYFHTILPFVELFNSIFEELRLQFLKVDRFQKDLNFQF